VGWHLFFAIPFVILPSPNPPPLKGGGVKAWTFERYLRDTILAAACVMEKNYRGAYVTCSRLMLTSAPKELLAP
jgi:hypothetical protein